MPVIVVVDDNAPSRELLFAILKTPDRRIFEASDGAQALGIIEREHPELVLLDIEMPVMDGFAVLRKLRRDPELAATRVVAVTANAMQGARDRAIAAGFDGYVTKPVSAQAIRREVERLLSASNKESDHERQ